MHLLLGYDIGTSSVKASLVDVKSGRCVASCFWPQQEAPIIAKQTGWAEQEPTMWWDNLKVATQNVMKQAEAKGNDVLAIGISYQMHGLVCVDKEGKVLRPSIIWCDGRAVPYGNAAFDAIGHERALSRLLNSPGNFTAAKLAWVKANEPELFERIYKVILPGDYIAMRLSGGCINTTVSGLSEGIFWDFESGCVSRDVLDAFGFDDGLIPDIVPTFACQCALSKEVAAELGLAEGTPIAYRGGDQPNNALSLNVMRPGEIAATAGTSGVCYAVTELRRYDPQSRVNTFAHVNHSTDKPRLGVLLCINGTGILNAWMRRLVAADVSYADINELAAKVPAGSDGVTIVPFGNGAERILQNREVGASIHGVNFNIHGRNHLLRAAQEGIVFSFQKGIDVMREMGTNITNIHAGHANMFLSPLFREALATVSGAVIDLYNTDGAAGAAKGAGIGAGIYANSDEAFATLEHVATIHPSEQEKHAYKDAYHRWTEYLNKE